MAGENVNSEEESNALNKPLTDYIIPPVEGIVVKDFLIQFLKDTKEWNKVSIEKDYRVCAKSAKEVTKLINNLRVYISRLRQSYRINGKPVPQFRFTSKIVKLTEPNENGYANYQITLGKFSSLASSNRQILEDLL